MDTRPTQSYLCRNIKIIAKYFVILQSKIKPMAELYHFRDSDMGFLGMRPIFSTTLFAQQNRARSRLNLPAIFDVIQPRRTQFPLVPLKYSKGRSGLVTEIIGQLFKINLIVFGFTFWVNSTCGLV